MRVRSQEEKKVSWEEARIALDNNICPECGQEVHENQYFPNSVECNGYTILITRRMSAKKIEGRSCKWFGFLEPK